jgi:hypothetical protein
MNEEKGCVYFFKHVGLSPIKIGYSENESPFFRFNQFKTYAPFGAELIGFIKTKNAKELETTLHQKYARDRIKGEWFEITKEDAEKCIKYYSELEDIEEMNSFQIAWATKNLKQAHFKTNFFNFFSLEEENNSEKVILNYKELSDFLKENKSDLIKNFKDIFDYKTFRFNGINKKGVLLYKKNNL